VAERAPIEGLPRREGRGWKFYLVVTALVLLAIFVIQNSQTVPVEFLFTSIDTPLFFALLVAGALDARFAALAAEMAAAIGPAAHRALVPGAGHAAHLERPAELAALLDGFLTDHLAAPRDQQPPDPPIPGRNPA